MTETTNSYFELIENHFRTARGTTLYMLSPRDWALIEAWKSANIPVEAVLRGIDTAFERWRKQPARARAQMVNSLCYCTNAIAEEAQAMANAAPSYGKTAGPPFNIEDIRVFSCKNAAALRLAGHCDLAASLESLNLHRLYSDLEHLEEHLIAIEEKMITRLREGASEEALLKARRDLARDLNPYRGKMTADQLASLEKQFLDRWLLESAGLPRLSLFYLGLCPQKDISRPSDIISETLCLHNVRFGLQYLRDSVRRPALRAQLPKDPSRSTLGRLYAYESCAAADRPMADQPAR